MSTNWQQELLELSIAERIQLAEDLWESVLETPEQVSVTEAQQAELERRLSRFSSDAPLSSWEDVKNRLKT